MLFPQSSFSFRCLARVQCRRYIRTVHLVSSGRYRATVVRVVHFTEGAAEAAGVPSWRLCVRSDHSRVAAAYDAAGLPYRPQRRMF